MNSLTFEQLEKVALAYEERLYLEVTLPGIRASMANMTDEACADLLRTAKHGQKHARTVRDKAFELLAEEAAPWHLRRSPAKEAKRAPVLPLSGISRSAARGLVQAVKAGLVSQANWLKIYPVFERVRVTAGDREP